MGRSIARLVLSFAALGIGSTVASTVARAQSDTQVTVTGGENLPPELLASLRDAVKQMAKDVMTDVSARTVRISPTTVTVDAATKTATFELNNSTSDSMTVSLQARLTPQVPIEMPQFTSDQLAHLPKDVAARLTDTTGRDSMVTTVHAPNALLADEPDSANAPGISRNAAIDSAHSMVAWIKDLPSQIRLAPKEKKTIKVRVEKPSGTAAGTYSAWVVAVTETTDIKPHMPAVPGVAGDMQISTTKLPRGTMQSPAMIQYQVQ